MKQKLVITTLFVAFALIIGMNVYNAQKSDVELSGWALENVEALASSESGGTIYCCGNYGVCIRVMDSEGKNHDVAGIKFSTPCPK